MAVPRIYPPTFFFLGRDKRPHQGGRWLVAGAASAAGSQCAGVFSEQVNPVDLVRRRFSSSIARDAEQLSSGLDDHCDPATPLTSLHCAAIGAGSLNHGVPSWHSLS